MMSGIVGLLEHFSIPLLQQLTINFQWLLFENDEKEGYMIVDHPPWPQAEFISFMQQSSCSIMVLHLGDVYLLSIQFVDILSCVSSTLEQISIVGVRETKITCIDDQVLQLLNCGMASDNIVCSALIHTVVAEKNERMPFWASLHMCPSTTQQQWHFR
jgi:hypothetical protein